jgi:AhpD family alkylhydroperoxidase
MALRLNHVELSPEHIKGLLNFSGAVRHGVIDAGLRHLIDVRVSQMNGCAFCLDMHSKEAKLHGERELRLYHVAIWRESPLFSAREKAALAWAETLTTLSPHGVSDEAFAAVRAEFSEKEVSDLTFAIVAINAWNRLGVAFTPVPGSGDAQYGLDKAGLK